MERYQSLGPIYYREAVAAIIVYDQTEQDSANDVSKWLDSFRAIVKTPAYIVIVGNKDDLDNKVVSNKNMEDWAKENNFDFFLTSAKTGKNVNELFTSVVKHLVKSRSVETTTTQKLNEEQTNQNAGCC